MDIILYRYLLRRLYQFPITFSRNKHYEQYNSIEGDKAVKRVKLLRKLSEIFDNVEYYSIYFEKIDTQEDKPNFFIKVEDPTLNLKIEAKLYQFDIELLKLKYFKEIEAILKDSSS